MKSSLIALPLLAATFSAVPANASRHALDRSGINRPVPDRTAIADYVHARAADDLGELDVAAKGYAAALAASPGNTTLALRTFRQAIAAGDMDLAARTATGLDQSGSLPPDGTVVLIANAIGRKDWKGASALADRLEKEKLFAFMAPIVRGWIAFGSGKGDPLALATAAPPGGLGATYGMEHRALLLLAMGKADQGIEALNALDMPDTARAARLRIAAAATLSARHKRDIALSVLIGDAPAVGRARALIQAKKALPGAIDSPATGVAELFVRVASDINRDQSAPLALEFARIGASLAPQDSEAWLVSASLLTAGGAPQAALDALGHVRPDDPFIGSVRDARLTILTQLGDKPRALAEAEAATRAPDAGLGDWARYGDMLSAAKRPADAAAAYARAIALGGGDKTQAQILWPLLLQQGNALMQAGDWPAARQAVQKAVTLAPDQPDVLNFLGYSELERGEDAVAAGALIARASQLAPDDPSITDSLGWSWYLRGDLGKAVPLLERAARGAPAESDINEHLGDAYYKAGRRLDARYAWRAALVSAEDDQAARIRTKIDYGVTGKP